MELESAQLVNVVLMGGQSLRHVRKVEHFTVRYTSFGIYVQKGANHRLIPFQNIAAFEFIKGQEPDEVTLERIKSKGFSESPEEAVRVKQVSSKGAR